MRISARFPRVIASLLTIVLLLATVTFTAGWYQPAADPPAISEKTSNFLPSDTTAYFSFNLLPGYTQSTRLTYFLSFFKDAILTKIGGVSSWGAGYVNTTPWSSIVGPELALATYNVSGDPGIVFFVQVSSGQTSAAIQELVILAMNTVLGGASSPSYPGGGVTQIDRTVGGAIKTEYYTNTTVGVSPDRYVLGTIGNVSLTDFQTLNASVTSGAWTGGGVSLSSNLDFIDVRAKLPTARMGLGFMNGSDLQDNAIGLSGAVNPYITALEGLIPGFSMVDAGLSILSSSSFALIEPYIPPYAGMSVSGINNGLQADFYSPDGSFPFAPGVLNTLSTARLVTSDAQLYYTDVNLNAWWQILQPNASAFHTLADDLSAAGLDSYIGFNISLLADLAMDPGLDANVFNWSTGEFAAAQVPYSGGTGYLLVLNVSDYTQAAVKIVNLITALGNISISADPPRFMFSNTSVIVGWPTGIIAGMSGKPLLSTNANLSSMRSLLSPFRGLFYKDAGAPLVDIGASYYIGSAKGRIVFRVPPPGGSGPRGGGGGGGGRGGGGISVPVPPFVPVHPAQLFDITLTLDSATLNNSSDLTARMLFESFGTVPTAVDLTFIVLNESGQEVYRAADNISVETEYNYVEKFPNLKLPAGNYVLVAKTLYNVSVSDEFRQGFSVSPAPAPCGGLGAGAWAGIGIAIVIALALLIYLVLVKIYPPAKWKSKKKP